MQEFLAVHSFENEIERERALVILTRVEEWAGTPCPRCGGALVGQEIVASVVLGYQDAPLCHACLSHEHDEDAAAFLVRMSEYVDRVPCFRATWEWCGSHGGEIRAERDAKEGRDG